MGNPAATVITSSPLLILLSPSSGDVRVINARRLAEEPELTSEQNLTPRYSAKFFSNSSVYLPDVSQNSRALSTRLAISSLSYTLEAYGILSPSVYSGFLWNSSQYSLTRFRICCSFSFLYNIVLLSLHIMILLQIEYLSYFQFLLSYFL